MARTPTLNVHIAPRQPLARTDAPRGFWTHHAKAVELGREEFRLVAHRRGLPSLNIDGITTDFSWVSSASNPSLTGSITVINPEGGGADDKPTRLPLNQGNLIYCWASPWGLGSWKEVWRMRISEPQVRLSDGSHTFSLADDLTLIGQSRFDFKYVRNKRHPHGWTVHQVVADICDRAGIQAGTIAKAPHRIKNLVMRNASPVEAIVRAYTAARRNSGHRYVLSFSRGELHIRPLRQSGELLLLGPMLIEATLNTEALKSTFATSLTGRSVVGKKKKKHKIAVTVTNKNRVQRYGYIHKQVKLKDVDSAADARKQLKHRLARMAAPKQEITLEHPGLTRLAHGDAVSLFLPEEGFKETVWATDVEHRVSAGTYTTTTTISFDNPTFVEPKSNRKDKKKK